MSERVGVIGCGTIGTAVVKALLASGYSVTVHDAFEDQAKPLISDGAIWAENPAKLAKDVDVLLTALPAPQHVRAAMEEGDEAALCVDLLTYTLLVVARHLLLLSSAGCCRPVISASNLFWR